jgi:hypothetical protein
MEHVVCIYHKNCIDGTTAAAVVLKRFPSADVVPLRAFLNLIVEE